MLDPAGTSDMKLKISQSEVSKNSWDFFGLYSYKDLAQKKS